jgi:WD40 repeat protein
MDSIIVTQEIIKNLNVVNDNNTNDIFDSYYGWKITDNGRYFYNNGIEEQPTLIYDTKTNDIFELSYPKKMNTGYQFVVFTPTNIFYNSFDNIIIEDYSHKIIRIIHNNNAAITNIIKNNKYLFVSDNDNTLKAYDLETFDIIFSTYFYNMGNMNVSHDNKYLVTAWSSINVYDLEENKLLVNYKCNTSIVEKEIAISKYNIAGLYKNKSIMICDLYGAGLYGIYEYDKYKDYHYLNYSHDEKYLYYGNNHEFIIFESYNYKKIKKYELENVSSYYLTNDDYKILYINDEKLETIYTPQFNKFIHGLIIEYLPEELIMNVLFYL